MTSNTTSTDKPTPTKRVNRKRKAGPALASPLKAGLQIDHKGHISGQPIEVAQPEPVATSVTPPETNQIAPKPSKHALLLELLRRPEGASLADMKAATGWQVHSCRGFIAGFVKKKLGLPVDARKDPDRGERIYRIIEVPQ